jgi:competence protein ComEA
MKRWETYFITTALAAGLTGAPLAWAQQQMPKSAAPPSPAAAASAATSTTPSVAPASAAVTGAQVNINSADEAALTSVKGIGKAKAKAIIEYREKNGPFQSIDDLTKIKGIKSKSLQKFKSQLTVG